MTPSRPGVRRFTVQESREAMVVTAHNLAEVARWCGGRVLASGDVMFQTGREEHHDTDFAYPGDVLVHNEPYWFTVLAETFDRHVARWQWTEETP